MKGGSVDQNIKTKFMEFFDCLKILWQKIQRKHIFKICEKKWQKTLQYERLKNKNIIVVQYTMVRFFHFSEKLVNKNKNNIDLSP